MAAQPLCHDAVRLCTVNMQTRSHLQVLPALNFLFSMLFLAQIPKSSLNNSKVSATSLASYRHRLSLGC